MNLIFIMNNFAPTVFCNVSICFFIIILHLQCLQKKVFIFFLPQIMICQNDASGNTKLKLYGT